MSAITLSEVFTLDRPGDEELASLVMEFCGTGEETSTFDLSLPFLVNDGDCVATDGKALIRVPGLRLKEWPRGKSPDIEGTIRHYWMEGPFVPLPPERLVEHENQESFCPFCERSGECGVCEGEGKLYTHNGRAIKCSNCHGHGYVHSADCTLCHGDVNFNAWLDESMGHTISARYSRMVRRIPGVLHLASNSSDKPILFVGDGGIRALVMSVKGSASGSEG